MTFAWPQLLWLVALPLALLVWELTHRRRTQATARDKILRAEAGPHSLKLAGPDASAVRNGARVRPWLCLALAAGTLALARPQWGRLEEPVFDQAREILIAIDLSRSMLAPDVKPSRLDRAKLLTQSLLERLTGERVGLIVFSGTAFLQVPLSSDYEILREFLPALNFDFLPEGGTHYGALIDTSLAAFASTSSADRFLIVLSDGEATDENWRDRMDELKSRGVRVIALGVGTAAGAMIPDGAGGLVKDDRGAVVLSKLESGTLRELAGATNGVYHDASAWIDLAALVESTVSAGQAGQFVEKNTVRLVERFQWPLGLALWFLLVSLYYEFPVRPKPRAITLRSAAPGSPVQAARAKQPSTSTAAVALLLLCAMWVVLPSPTRAAEPAPESPLLSRIVTRLAAAEQRTARDWAEFGRETVTWGTRLQTAQQPVPEGPVRDALAAAELGSQADPKATDWTKLRQELEALLQKPEEQKEQQQQQQQSSDQQNQQQQNQQDQQKQDEQKSSRPQQQQNSEQQQQEQQKSQSQEQSSPPKSEEEQQQEKRDSAFGDMKEPPPPPPQETQKVGGVPEKPPGDQPPPSDPALAVPLQKLEQLRNQDSPAELFQLMEDQKPATPRKKGKDW